MHNVITYIIIIIIIILQDKKYRVDFRKGKFLLLASISILKGSGVSPSNGYQEM